MSGSFLRSIDIAIAADLDPVAAALDFAQRVRADVAEEIAAGRAAKRFTRYVDGREGADERAVKPGGTILYEFGMMPEIAAFALAFLQARSPTGPMPTGGSRLYNKPYRESFYASVGGRFIRPGEFAPASVPEDGELIFGNVQPYSRKADVQLVGRKPLRFNVPPGIFADAARAVNRTFGNFVTARAVYSMTFPGQYRIKESQARSGSRAHNVKRWAGSLVESPALIISQR